MVLQERWRENPLLPGLALQSFGARLRMPKQGYHESIGRRPGELPPTQCGGGRTAFDAAWPLPRIGPRPKRQRGRQTKPSLYVSPGLASPQRTCVAPCLRASEPPADTGPKGKARDGNRPRSLDTPTPSYSVWWCVCCPSAFALFASTTFPLRVHTRTCRRWLRNRHSTFYSKASPLRAPYTVWIRSQNQLM